MSRSLRATTGILSITPLAWLLAAVILLAMHNSFLRLGSVGRQIVSLPLAIHLLVSVLSLALMAWYAIDANVNANHRKAWFGAFLLVPVLAFPVYWFKHFRLR